MSWTYTSSKYDGRYLQLYITESTDAASNSSTLTWTLTSAGGAVDYYTIDETTVSINGTTVYHKGRTYWNSYEFPAAKGSKSGTIKITHNADGTKSNVYVSFKTRVYVYGSQEFANAYITLSNIATYTLSLSAGTGSNITVNRTASGYAGTGNLSSGARLYYNDKLKITFTPSTNYAISTHTVNGSTFSSGNTYTVTGNVSVKATAQVLASSVGATDANVGSTSTVTVTKYNSSYYHSLQYKFGSLSGYITSSGRTQSSEAKFSNSSVAFRIPTSFYAQIPNSPTGKCTITCRTYSNSGSTSVLGNATTCTITITATGVPTVSGSVVDTNATTIALTGDSSKLIRYKSMVKATITATAQNSASIASKFINGVAPTDNVRIFSDCSETLFIFKATDSRGYSVSVTKSPTVIAYIQLTINPILSRPTPTGDSITMSFSGDFYRGSFGAATNSLTIQYRYKESGGSYGSWKNVESSKIVFGTRSYTSSSAFALDDEFDYKKEYQFQVRAKDGTTEHPLSTVTKNITVPRGIPVFDWGEKDFNFNVPVMLNNVNLLNVIYPIGSIYMSVNNTNPGSLFGGTWEKIKGRFLLAADDETFTLGQTGGSQNNTHHHWMPFGFDRFANRTSFYLTIENSADNKILTGVDKVVHDFSEVHSTGNVRANTTADETISIMPPYMAVYMWKRVT